jgi:anti-sigma B factor antagonist
MPVVKPGLKIAQSNVGAVKVLRLDGYLDGHTFIDLERFIDDLLKQGTCRLVIELSGMTYIASAGVGVFISAQHKANKSGGNLQLVNPSDSVREIFNILGLERLFVIHDTVEQGLAAAKA